MGINAPETRGEEKEAGLIVKSYVKRLLVDKELHCQWIKNDKFGGRFDGYLYVNGVKLGEHLVSIGLAVPWNGKGKRPTVTIEQIKEMVNYKE